MTYIEFLDKITGESRIDSLRLDFTTESPKETVKVLRYYIDRMNGRDTMDIFTETEPGRPSAHPAMSPDQNIKKRPSNEGRFFYCVRLLFVTVFCIILPQ